MRRRRSGTWRDLETRFLEDEVHAEGPGDGVLELSEESAAGRSSWRIGCAGGAVVDFEYVVEVPGDVVNFECSERFGH